MTPPRTLMGPWRTFLLAVLLVANLIVLMRMSIPEAPTQGPTPGGAAPTSVMLPAPAMLVNPTGTRAERMRLERMRGWHVGRGVVTRVDADEQKVEIDHDAIPGLEMDAGKSLLVSVSPALPTLRPGMKVVFYLESYDGNHVVMRITPIVPPPPDLLELPSQGGASGKP